MGINYKKCTAWLSLAILARYFLYYKYFNIFRNRTEISTPLNSFKRIQEGVHLYTHGIDPYTGDMFHENPITLWILTWAINTYPNAIPFMYIVLDVLTGLILYKMAITFLQEQFSRQKTNITSYASDTQDLQLQKDDLHTIPNFVLLAYLFNPFAMINCAALTSTVFSNLLLSMYFYFLVRKKLSFCLLCLSLETLRSMYPFVLLAPAILTLCGKSKVKALGIVGYFLGFGTLIAWACSKIMGNWLFLDNTLGFIFFYRNLQPNIGLFWYFFTEMFDHFRTMFLITFQMNATVLYLIPLSIKLRKEPLILATILTALTAIFRSYPCIGDIGFYLALLPIWRRCWKFMAHNFVVFCFFLITMMIMPAIWHLWIYSGSANANFYFGVTLAFSTGQIFLVTDLLFAYVKRDFCLKNGQKFVINGKEARIILE